MMTWWIAAVVVVSILVIALWSRLRSDGINEMNDKRRKDARLVGRGEFVDGSRHLPVALALTDRTLFYENADMEASLDLQWVREVEYDNSLATGSPVGGGQVMRLRCFSQTFEFVVPEANVAAWKAALPARAYSEAATA